MKDPEHAEFYKTYLEATHLLWKQRKVLKIFKQNSGITQFRFCENHSGSIL